LPATIMKAAGDVGVDPSLINTYTLRRIRMKSKSPIAGACLALLSFLCIVASGSADAQTNPPPTWQAIVRAGTQASRPGPDEFFTGRVRVDDLWAADADINSSGSMVTFEPGARSAWHTHPIGQRLVVASGVGLTQEWGKPTQVIRPGDVVTCPPGVKHWHGAAPTTAMTHLAVTGSSGNKNVTWMEKVSDEQYNAR